jgi:acyl-CoA reductase-like NAD-dependent aldehyde dehydrogenase
MKLSPTLESATMTLATVPTPPWLGPMDDVISPWDGSVVGAVPAHGPDDVDAACKRAAKALARRDFPQHRRAEVLDRAAVLVAASLPELSRLIVAESGKPLVDARGEVARCVDTLRLSAAEARRMCGTLVPLEATESGAGRLGFALRVPAGVVAAITPFNFPLNLVAHKLGPAIAAGCPVVLKPAEQTPLTAVRFVDLLIEAGLPRDWVSLVTGTGEDVGAPLASHPLVRVVSFTGSVPVGRAISSAAHDKRVLLELGANAPVIVQPDADLARVVAAIRKAGFSNAGQSCISTQRVLVHESRHQQLLSMLRDAVSTLVCGDPRDEATEVGPLICPADTERVRAWLVEALEGGGQLVVGGELDGPVLRPAVVDTPPLTSRLYAEEVFGPVITVTPYSCLDEAIALANDSRFGLQVGIFTSDLGTALRVIEDLEFGGVIVNDVPTWRADQQPYGGLRDSGNTREGPAYTVEDFTELRFVALRA